VSFDSGLSLREIGGDAHFAIRAALKHVKEIERIIIWIDQGFYFEHFTSV
jgi:hypothetical protein